MVTVITYGTFDMLHVGHVRLLKRCKELGDRLVVGVSTDEFNCSKGKTARFSFSERVEIVSSLKMVDLVFPEESWDQKPEDFRLFDAKIFCMGSDWKNRFYHYSDLISIVYIERTPGVSSSSLKGQYHQAL